MKRRLAGPFPALGRAALLAQLLAALAFAAVLLHSEGTKLPFTGAGDWTVTAAFADAGGLHTGERTPVLVAGVPSGWVSAVSVQRGVAVLSLTLSSSARNVVRRDATAQIEPRSALQDLTVDLSSGSPSAPALAPGDRIAAAQTRGTTTLDRVVSVLDGDTRAQLSVLIGALAQGSAGRGSQLREAVMQLHSLLSPAQQVVRGLAARRVLLSGLVGSLSRLGAAAQAHDGALARSLSAGEQTLRAVAARQRAVANSLSALPATMDSLDGALGSVQRLSTPLVPTLSSLRATVDALPGALTAARGVAPAASSLLSAASSFARVAGPGLRTAADVLGQLGGTARTLTPLLTEAAPIVSAVNARRDGIGQLGERFSGVLSTNDANGPILRGLGTFEPFNPANFGFANAAGPRRAALAAQAASALTLTCLHGGLAACLVRYLVPGLPGSVR